MLEDIYNFLQLSEGIATSGQPTEDQFGDVAEAGYEIVINLALKESDFALKDEEGTVRRHGMEYVHIPVIWEDPTPENLEGFLSIMEVHQENKVFVHCVANMRVSVFMALYRVLRLGWNQESALEDVRRIWEPNEIWDAFIQQALRG